MDKLIWWYFCIQVDVRLKVQSLYKLVVDCTRVFHLFCLTVLIVLLHNIVDKQNQIRFETIKLGMLIMYVNYQMAKDIDITQQYPQTQRLDITKVYDYIEYIHLRYASQITTKYPKKYIFLESMYSKLLSRLIKIWE